jgi:hypothetical protein
MRLYLLAIVGASVACSSAAPPAAEPIPVAVGAGTPVNFVSADAQNVLSVVDRLYDSIRAHDTAGMRVAFHSDGRFFVSSVTNGQPLLRMVPLNIFLGSIAGSGERLVPAHSTPPEVRVAGNVATVWSPYVLRRGNMVSHCGVDAFQLARTPQGWRIIQLFEMQQREGC